MNNDQLEKKELIKKEMDAFISHERKKYPLRKEVIALSQNFLLCAKIDIQSCKILYENKQYPSSTYHLQQASEKLMKSYALRNGEISENELIRPISHVSPKLFPHLANKLSDYKNLIEAIYPDVFLIAKTTQKFLDDPENHLKLAQVSYKDIKSIFEKYKIEVVKNKMFTKQEMMIALLYVISFITFPHEKFSRYPDGKMKPTDYTQDLGIVMATPELIKYLEEIHKYLQKEKISNKPFPPLE